MVVELFLRMVISQFVTCAAKVLLSKLTGFTLGQQEV